MKIKREAVNILLMKHIIWQPESNILVDSFNNRSISSDCRGGYIYEYHAAVVLSEFYKVTMDKEAPRLADETSFQYLRRLHKNTINGDVFIIAPPIITHGRRRKDAVEIGILHHVYLSQKKQSVKGKLSLKVLKWRLRNLDLVVTVSKFWANFLEGIGCRDVRIIYNAFNPKEFVFGQEEIQQFLITHNIPNDKPIVYIGYADPTKGVNEVFDILKNYELTLVMTGPITNKLTLPVHWLCLNRKDYLLLLSACDVVVNMSKIEEGWSRIAHEALLCRTPVIGSGSGGMKELLEESGQKICYAISDLPDMVKEIINNKKSYAERGYNFATKFNYEVFAKEWRSLLQEIA
ncbi:MAG: glycosyltransferase family 4 protein [Desulfobacterales bacterium]